MIKAVRKEIEWVASEGIDRRLDDDIFEVIMSQPESQPQVFWV